MLTENVAMAYETLHQNSDTSGDGVEDLKIHLYYNSNSFEDIVRNEFANGLKALCENLLPNIIFAYEIRIFPEPMKLPADKNAYDMWNDHWRDITIADKGDVEGIHFLGYDGPSFDGYADSPKDEGGWVDSHSAVQSYNGNSYYYNALGPQAAHEVMHPLINKENDDVQQLIRTDDQEFDQSHEHDLGKVYGFTVSPMAIGYTGLTKEDHASHGSCSTGKAWGGGFTNDITYCTAQALCHTSRNTCGE